MRLTKAGAAKCCLIQRATLFLLVLSVACSSGGDEGSAPLHSTPEDDVVIATPSRELATEDVVPKGLAGPVSAIVSPDGLICIADPKDGRVIVLSAELTLVGVYGSPGEGPGELRRPAVCRADSDHIAVFDPGTARITEYHARGEVAATRPVQKVISTSPTMLLDGRLVSVRPEGRYVELTAGGRGESVRTEIPAEMCEMPPGFFRAMFFRLASTGLAERVVLASQIGCPESSEISIAVLRQDGTSQYVPLPPPEHVGAPGATAGNRQIMTVASVATTESLVAVLHASTGVLNGQNVVPLDLLTGPELHRVRRYVVARSPILLGVVAILPGDHVLILDPETLLLLSPSDLRMPTASATKEAA